MISNLADSKAKPTYLTEKGLQKFETELEQLRHIERPMLAARLKEVVENLDAGEDNEYLLVKDEQAMLEGRIFVLETLLAGAKIIQQGNGGGTITLGSTVVVQEGDGPLETYLIVGSAEADSDEGFISDVSPLGKALFGHKVGETVTSRAPDGDFVFKIISVT
jgi:transcription elongation factor GreA